MLQKFIFLERGKEDGWSFQMSPVGDDNLQENDIRICSIRFE